MSKQNNILITATDTDVGKTIFAAGLAGALNCHYWKPIQAGYDAGSDSDVVKQYSGLSSDKILPEAYKLKRAASPHFAAECEHISIDLNQLTIPELAQGGKLVIEAAGGLMVPLIRPHNGSNGILSIDLFAIWKVPTILVVRTSLGTINHSLLSIKALKDYNIPILGIVFIGDENIDSQKTILEFAKVANLGRLGFLENLNKDLLIEAVQSNIRLDLILT